MTKAELQAKLNDTLTAVRNATPGVQSAVALIASLRQELADAIANAGDLTDAAAVVDEILSTHESNAKALSDGMAATPPANPNVP